MIGVLKLIFNFAVWVFVPVVLFMIIRYIYGVHKRTDHPERSATAKSGFWAGFVLFVMALIYQVGIFIVEGFPNNEIYQGFDLTIAAIGIAIGFLLFAVGKKGSVAPPAAAGFIALVTTFAAFSALVHYLFIRTYNEILISLIMGLTAGALIFSALSPKTLKEFIHPASNEQNTAGLL